MYGVTSGIQTYVTLVGDECTHHYTISAPVDNFLIYIGDPKELDKRNMFCEMWDLKHVALYFIIRRREYD